MLGQIWGLLSRRIGIEKKHCREQSCHGQKIKKKREGETISGKDEHGDTCSYDAIKKKVQVEGRRQRNSNYNFRT